MEQNKDQIGAAVRGEAVAELPARRFVHVTGFIDADYVEFKAGQNYGGGVCAGVERESKHYTREDAEECVRNGAWREVGALSARAADAPSEPSELVLAFGKGLIEVGQGHHGNERKPAILFGRNGAGAVGIETEGDRVMLPGECIAALTFDNPESLDVVAEKFSELRARIWPKSRAADALDSQPTVLAYVATDLDGRADVGMTPEKAMERAGHGCDTIIPVYDLGSSQPTDGGVRNG